MMVWSVKFILDSTTVLTWQIALSVLTVKFKKLQSRSQITSLLSLLSVNNMATVSKNVIILKTRVCEPVTVPAENQKRCSNTSPHKRVNKSYHIRIVLSCVERNCIMATALTWDLSSCNRLSSVYGRTASEIQMFPGLKWNRSPY